MDPDQTREVGGGSPDGSGLNLGGRPLGPGRPGPGDPTEDDRCCEVCGVSLAGLRKDARYCGDAHRKTAMNRRQKESGNGYHKPAERHLTSWTPKPQTEQLLADVQEVLAEYTEQLPVTVRQVFYRLAGKGRPKSKSSEKQLYRALRLGRRFDRIPFDAIRDDTGAHLSGDGAREGDDHPAAYAQQALDRSRFALEDNSYRRGRHEGQPVYIDMWAEAAGMAPQLSRWVSQYGVAVHSGTGFDGLSLKWRMAQVIAQRDAPTVLFHLGDLDWHGRWVYRALFDDLEGFAPHAELEVVRLAVTEEQVERLGLTAYSGAVQAEAVAPDELQRIVVEAVKERYDEAIAAKVRQREERERREVDRRLAELRAKDAHAYALLRAFGWEDA
jgi:hypothetical protein